MTHLSPASLIAVSVLIAGLASARIDTPPTNAAGQPLADVAGQPLNYSQQESAPAIAALSALKGIAPMAAPAPSWDSAPGPTRPFWSYGVFGSNIGLRGMVPVTHAHGTEVIIASTAAGDFGSNSFWYVLNHDPETDAYQQIHVQPPYSSTIVAMSRANVTGDSTPELVVGLADGRFFFYSPDTFQQLGTIRPVADMTDFATPDLNGDGVAELVVINTSNLRVCNAFGQPQWTLTGPGGYDLVVAQMDQDAALEIATTSGHVVDVVSRSVQWTRVGGFGARLRAADIDGDQRSELVAAEGWYYLRAFDVDTQTEKWAYRADLDIGSIEIANVDADPAPELLYGDGQWGELHVMTLNGQTPVEEWHIPNPEHGVQGICVADSDGDGSPEILWTAGGSSTGRDRLEVRDTATRLIEWVSEHLDGPFISPVVGDVTGDGVPELVTASSESNSGYSSGRILVFDSATLKLLGTSQPIVDGLSWMGLRDLKLRDVDGDGRMEIVVAADRLYDGVVEVYRFTDAHGFERQWTNASRPSGAPFTQVDVLDVDDDGDLEVVVGNDTAHTGSTGNHVRLIDYATKLEEWKSPHLTTYWGGVRSMVVGDVDGDGRQEAVAALGTSGLAAVDLKLRTVTFAQAGDFTTTAFRAGDAGFLAGSPDGKLRHFGSNGASGYQLTETWNLSPAAITGLTRGEEGSLWVSTNQRVSYWPDSEWPDWTSDKLSGDASSVGLLETPFGFETYAGLPYAVSGFQVVTHGPPTVTAAVTGSMAEGSSNTASLTVSRNEIAVKFPLEVRFTLEGSASAEIDFTLEGATRIDDTTWMIEIPAGELTATATLRSLQDRLPEGAESVQARLLTAETYSLGTPETGAASLADDEPVVSVSASDPSATEPLAKKDPGAFTFHRTGDLSSSLEVTFNVGGTATANADYDAIASRAVFPPGRATVTVTVVPRADDKAEPTESVEVQLIGGADYLAGGDASHAGISLHDTESVVSIAGTKSSTAGVTLTLTRTAAEAKTVLSVPMTVVIRYPSGETTTTVERVTFTKGAINAQCLFRPRRKAVQAAQVSVELIKEDPFHLGSPTSISFELPAALVVR